VEDVVVSYPSPSESAIGSRVGFLKPINVYISWGVRDPLGWNVELFRLKAPDIRERKIVGEIVGDRDPVDSAFAVNSGRDSVISPAEDQGYFADTVSGQPLDRKGASAVRNKSTLHGFNIFAINVVRLLHSPQLPRCDNVVTDIRECDYESKDCDHRARVAGVFDESPHFLKRFHWVWLLFSFSGIACLF